MEQKKDNSGVVQEFLRRLATDTNKEIPKELLFNSMTTTNCKHKIFFRPNNYRRQIKVNAKDNSTIEKVKSAIKCYSYCEHTKILSIKQYRPSITIQYGKDTLTGIYHQNIIAGTKEIFLIERETIKEIQDKIDDIKNTIQDKIDTALKDFIKEFNLQAPLFNPKWARYEDFIKGLDYIDKIPKEVIIHDTIFKKVYTDGIEFKNSEEQKEPTVHLKNTIKNLAIRDVAPDIAKSLEDNNKDIKEIAELIFKINASTSSTLNQFVTTFLPIQQEHALNIKTHTSVLKNIESSFKKFNKLLANKQQEDLRKWF